MVTASRVEETLLNAPATVSVLTSDIIENAGGQNYGDMLRAVPGVNVTQTSARDINIVSRGATSTLATSQIALMDGRTIYQDFFGFVMWDVLPIDMSEVDRIEVVQGPASAVWGANAMTGVVNVISKTPRELDSTSVRFGFGTINRKCDRCGTGDEGDRGQTYTLNLSHAQAVNDRWAYKLSGGFHFSDPFARPTGNIDNPFMTPYPPYPNSSTTQPKFDGRVDYDFPDGRQKLSFSGGYGGTSGIILTGIGPFDIQSGTAASYGQVKYRRDNWKVEFFTNLLDGDAPALLAIGPDGQPINFFFDTTTLDFNVSNSQIVGGKHLLNYGGNVRYNTFELSIAPRGDNRNEFGAYLQDEWFINDKFRWVLGARVDRFSILDKAIVSPRTTFLIKPDPDHTIRVSVNRAFRAPSFVNNFLQTAVLNQINLGAIDPRLSGVQYIFPLLALGNEGLDEESMTAYEVGYTGTFARRYTAGISFYYNDTRDSILFTTVDTYSSQNPPPGWPLPPFILDLLIQAGAGLPSELSYRNFEKLIDKGVELSLNARINREWSVYGNYSWQAEPEPIGFDLSEVNLPPKNRFNVGVNFNADRYFGSLSLAYQDSAFWQDVLDVRFDGPTESFALINGTFGVRFADQRLSAAVRFTNLGNDDVQQHVFGDIIKRQIVGEVTVHIR